MSNTDDIRRVRDVARRHGFQLSIRDAEHVWRVGDDWPPLPASDGDLFGAMLERLHEWLAENGDPTPPRQEPLPRAPIIDPNDGPCEICAQWAAAKYVQDETGKTVGFRCDECGEVIPDMGLMRGRGFNGVAPHHFHLRPIKGTSIPGREVILQELCPACYRRHRQAVYPNESPKELERHMRV